MPCSGRRAYSSNLTTSSVLRLGFTVVLALGVILELRNIAAERTLLLEHERQYARKLEDLTVLRSDFTAMVAHELASPLAGIQQWAKVLELEPLSTSQRRAAEAIASEATVLTVLVDDVQRSADAERDDFAVDPQPVAVSSIIGPVAFFARGLNGEHPVEVVNLTAGQVFADPGRIAQVLRNLTENAIKFSPPGTPVTLTARSVTQGTIRFEVTDRGPGIHPDDMTRIFEKFGRGRQPGGDGLERPHGAGLGLYLSKRIIRASGSELYVVSDPGKETTFWFDLEAVRLKSRLLPSLDTDDDPLVRFCGNPLERPLEVCPEQWSNRRSHDSTRTPIRLPTGINSCLQSST